MKQAIFFFKAAALYTGLTGLLFLFPGNLCGQPYAGLNRLEGYKINAYYSVGSKTNAVKMARRCDSVMAFYAKLIGFEPIVTLLMLSEEDWNKYTKFPVYGMPHYDDYNNLVVASEDNAFWRSFIPPADQLPEDLALQISNTYSDKNGNLTMSGFFDLLAIHELGHAFHMQGQLTMQRKWMGELFANILLHTYIAEKEPELLPQLTVFPEMVVLSTARKSLQFTTLKELESNYDKIGQVYPNNYGWYQCRWHMAAAKIYNEGKAPAFKNLWQALKARKAYLDDSSLASFLADQVHQSVADVQLRWDE